jgi:hypothetical protein
MFMHHLPGPDRWTAARRRRWFRPDPNPRLAQHRLQRCAILSSLGQTRGKGKIAHASVVWPREHAQLSRGFKKDGPARRRTGDESLFQGGREGGREGGRRGSKKTVVGSGERGGQGSWGNTFAWDDDGDRDGLPPALDGPGPL